MSDPLPTDQQLLADGAAAAERDARIEQLLLDGLDHYFAAEYAQAIDAWSRILFFDRNHARARAYIERARNATAERQRESEELLHRGVAAFQRGETEAARALLTSVLARGGPQDVALAVLDRLNRLETAAGLGGQPSLSAPRLGRRTSDRSPLPPVRPARRRRWPAVLALASALAIGAWAFIARDRLESWFFDRPELPLTAPTGFEDTPSPPRASEATIVRARQLMASGQHQDALRLLDAVSPADGGRAEIDRLRAEVQRTLLNSGGAPSALPPRAPGTPPQ